MKPLLIIVFTFLIFTNTLFAQPQNAPPVFAGNDSVYIRGKIAGFMPGHQDGFVSFITHTITGDSKKQAVQISNDGLFAITLYQQFAGDITFNYKDAFISIYTTPAQTLFLNVNDKLIDRTTGNKNAITASGQQAVINNILFRFQTEFSLQKFQTTANIGDKTQADSVFAARRTVQLNEELAYLDQFIIQNNITNTTFNTWQKNQLMYLAAKEIGLYPFLGKLNKDITTRQLSALTGTIPVENPEALHNSAYYDFLNTLISGQQIITNINPAYNEAKKANGSYPLPLFLNQIDSLSHGISRQLMYYATYQPDSKYNTDELKERFRSAINEPGIRQLFDKLSSASIKLIPYNLSARIKALNISNSLKKQLTGLFDKEKGTNLYLDFWGDWCGPCMSEMPGYPATIAAFKGKSLKFIFFSAYTTAKSMLAIKAKFGINAEFINLTNNELAVLNNVLEFHSYPSHFIINSLGNVVNNTARGTAQIAKELATANNIKND